MDAGSPDTWRWIWLVAMVTFGIGEMAVAGSFFLAPFAVGAGVAAVLAFAGVAVGIEWAAFLGVSVAAFAVLRPVAKRLDSGGPVLGIGSARQLGQRALVVEVIGGEHEHGTVILDRERWRAESQTGQTIPVGATVVVVEVRGTRVVVAPADSPNVPLDPPSHPGDSL